MILSIDIFYFKTVIIGGPIKDHVYYPNSSVVSSLLPGMLPGMAKISLKYGKKYLSSRVGDVGNVGYEYTFPFVDIFYYRENTTHMIPISPHVREIELGVIFPLHLRPLGNTKYFAPHDPYKFIIQLGFNSENCYTGYYNHSLALRRQSSDIATVPCVALKKHVAFVQHTRDSGGALCREVLTLGDQVLGEFVRSSENITH